MGILVGGFGLLVTLGGAGIIAQAVANSKQEIPSKEYSKDLWRNVPVEKLFPAAIGLQDPDKRQGDPDERGWTRAGVSSTTSCDKALSGELAKLASERGCVAALRASYVDDTGGTAATVAIVAFTRNEAKSDLDAILSEAQGEKRDYGVRALAAPGTQWKDAARAGSGGYSVPDPYTPLFVAVAAGPADGRRAGNLPVPWGGKEFLQEDDRSTWGKTAAGVAEDVAARLNDETRKVGA